MMLPSAAASTLLPGESRWFDLDAVRCQRVPRSLLCHAAPPRTVSELLDDGGTSLVGQVLITPQSGLLLTVPILQVTALAVSYESQKPYAELTCVGRGCLKLAPLDGGCARIDPLFDDEDSSPDVSAVQHLKQSFEDCRALMAKLSDDDAQWRREDARQLLERPLKSTLMQSERALRDGLQCLSQGGLDAAQCSKWQAGGRGELDELHLLTYAVARLLPRRRRAHAMGLTDGRTRIAYVERVLSDLEAELAAKVALQGFLEERRLARGFDTSFD